MDFIQKKQKKFSHIIGNHHLLIGLCLLALSSWAGFQVLLWGTFIDEGDNLAGGWLIAQGRVLYKDLFSHHFPFPYYWVAVIIKLFGPSVLIIRGSILVFQILSFAWAMYLTKQYIILGFASLIWNIIAHFYGANMILYSVFSGISLALVFVVFLNLLYQKAAPRWVDYLTLVVFSAIALLSDPLSIYAIGLVFIFLFALPSGWWGAFKFSFFLGVVGSLYLIYLVLTYSATDFFQNAILFNRHIYSKYFPAHPLRIQDIINESLTLLGVFDARWLNRDLWYELKAPFIEGIDFWIFTGLLYRLTILAVVIFLWMQRRWLTGGFIYLFAASLLAIHDYGFRAIPFVLIVMIVFAILIKTSISIHNETNHHQIKGVSLFFSILTSGLRLGSFILVLMMAWLVFRSTLFTIDHRDQLSYEDNFSKLERLANEVRSWSCGYPNTQLAYYPGKPYIYFFNQIPPVSNHLFMFPWVAEVAEQSVIASLQDTEAIVYVERNGQIWGRKNEEYLANLLTYLDTHYRQFGFNTYLSPKMYQHCVSQYRLTKELVLLDLETTVQRSFLSVDLYWQGDEIVYFNRRAKYYTAYIHLVDAEFSRLVGVDILIKKENIEILDEQSFKQHFDIPLPDNLPAGEYGLKIGVYHIENEIISDISSIHVAQVFLWSE